MKNALHPLSVIKDAIKTGTAYVVSSKRNKIIASIGLALSISGIVPLVHTKYKGYKAHQAIEETSQGIALLEGHIIDIQGTLDKNKFLFLSDEQNRYTIVISEAEDVVKQIKEPFTVAQKKYVAKEFGDVRRMLDSDFELKKGEKIRLTPLMIAEDSDKKITTSLGEMQHKIQSRDEIVQGEDESMAQLATPYLEGMTERKEKHAHLSDAAFRLIPVLGQKEFETISGYAPELQNSLGVKLLHHEVMRDHIRATAKAERIGKKAQSLFDEAREKFMGAAAANNKISKFYRAGDDGEYTQADYDKLRVEQQRVLNLIAEGNALLTRLEDLHRELHSPYYIFVSGHSRKPTTFSHTKIGLDSEGDIEITPYTTNGFKFYYDLTTVTPTGQQTEKVFVGEKDQNSSWSVGSWDYPDEQEVNYLREWKPLHMDNEGIIRGGNVSQVKPFEKCNPNAVELEKSEEQK